MKKIRVRRLAVYVGAFTAFGMVFSTLGFAYPQPATHINDYSGVNFAIEVVGHISFAMVVAVPLLDLNLILLAGALGILIDADHLLAALNLNAIDRPDHSILFVILATVLVVGLARSIPLGSAKTKKTTMIRAAVVAPVALMAHFAYDVVAAYGIFHGSGYLFPFFFPFSPVYVSMPYYSWALLGLLALTIATLASILSRTWSGPSERVSDVAMPTVGTKTHTLRTVREWSEQRVRSALATCRRNTSLPIPRKSGLSSCQTIWPSMPLADP